jgi:hypothetical protein
MTLVRVRPGSPVINEGDGEQAQPSRTFAQVVRGLSREHGPGSDRKTTPVTEVLPPVHVRDPWVRNPAAACPSSANSGFTRVHAVSRPACNTRRGRTFKMVETMGLEPTTSWLQTRCSTS